MAKKYNKTCSYCGIDISYYRGGKPDNCPNCGKERWLKPETETKLFLLQNEYLKNRSNDILGKMYLILKSYSSSIIKKIISGKFRYDLDWLEIKSHDATNALLEYYLTKPNFKVEQSFGSYLLWKVREVLYMYQNEEKHDSLNQHLQESNHKEFQDLVYLNGYKPVFGKTINDYEEEIENENEFIESLISVIDKQLSKIRNFSVYLSIMTYICLKIFFDKRKNSLTKYYNRYGGNNKNMVDSIVKYVSGIIYNNTKRSFND